ncbi:MAG: DUF2007 domain-containing protein [Acidobacteriia bacterium]|nr:DUF2007 domain-containing protein [Terriglobia bacterium]
MNEEAPVVVATTWMTTEASVIKSLLEGYNIPCHYSSQLPQEVNPLFVGRLAEIRIFVPAALAQEARRVLEEHRRRRHLHLVDP